MNWREVERRLTPKGLFVMGTLHEDGDALALIGAGSTMWDIFTQSDESKDGAPDPLDRWSKSIICPIAGELGAEAVFPSDGPPYAPFIRWAQESGRFWQSPVGMLVHDTAGLMVSIRGAIRIAESSAPRSIQTPAPCLACSGQPCRPACPVDALDAQSGYDVAACRAYLDTEDGQDCMNNGCKARRACPISKAFGRTAQQSAFHMRSFHPK